MPHRLRIRFPTQQFLTLACSPGSFALAGQAATLTPSAAEPTWKIAPNIPSVAFTSGTAANYDLTQHTTNFDSALHEFSVYSGTLPSGVTLNAATGYVYDGTTAAGAAQSLVIQIVDKAAVDWANRIAGPNVVWYHNFDSVNEVNQFRWTGGYSGGNDPLSGGSGSQYCTHQASGGADGGGYLRLTYPVGSAAGRGNSYWWRPFNPLTGAGNGRGTDDPGAGTLTPVAFTVSDGANVTNMWGNVANPGWYGNAAEQVANPTKYQGTDFYVQVRVRRAQTPGAPPDNLPSYTSITGKLVWFTNTNYTYAAQELVTYGQSVGNGDAVGVQSRHNVYDGQNFTSIGSGQPNATVTLSNLTLDWRYSGGWDTLLYHVTPGTNGGTGSDRTRVEVWAQHDPTLYPAESGVYTKIWDVTFTQGFDTTPTGLGVPSLPGWNAIICAAYHNGSAFTTTSFDYDYDQIIFSKATITAPTA